MSLIRTRTGIVALAVAALLLTGCASAPGAHPSAPAASSDPAPPADGGVDALTVTGPSQAATIPDMQPVVDDPVVHLPATVTAADGASVTIAHADRVLALDLYGTLTDTVIGLGLADRLVGRAMSDTQAALKDLPVVSRGGIDLNVEAVLDLDPDVVLTNTTIGSDASYRRLESAGVTVVRFAQVPHLAGIGDEIAAVGAVFGMTEAATALADHTADELAAARVRIDALRAATPRAPRAAVLYVRGTAGVFFVLGSDYGSTDIIEALGLEDVAKTNGITTLKPANAEALVTLDPEIVLAMTHGIESSGGVDGFLTRPGMAATTAGEHRRIVMAADSQLLSYGPRTPANLVALAEAVYAPAGA